MDAAFESLILVVGVKSVPNGHDDAATFAYMKIDRQIADEFIKRFDLLMTLRNAGQKALFSMDYLNEYLTWAKDLELLDCSGLEDVISFSDVKTLLMTNKTGLVKIENWEECAVADNESVIHVANPSVRFYEDEFHFEAFSLDGECMMVTDSMPIKLLTSARSVLARVGSDRIIVT